MTSPIIKSMAIGITQIRQWTASHAWMVNGYSHHHGIYWLSEPDVELVLPAGGWTLSSASFLKIRWSRSPSKETYYSIEFDRSTVYQSLWTPKLGETVTESFFANGDLWIMNYRVLKLFTEEEWLPSYIEQNRTSGFVL